MKVKKAGKMKTAQVKDKNKFIKILAMPWLAFVLLAAIMTVGVDSYIENTLNDSVRTSSEITWFMYQNNIQNKTVDNCPECIQKSNEYRVQMEGIRSRLIMGNVAKYFAVPLLTAITVLLIGYSTLVLLEHRAGRI